MMPLLHTQEPDMCTCLDDQQRCLIVEVVLPGAQGADVQVRMNSRCMVLCSSTDAIRYEKYCAFFRPVIPEQARACFHHELLRIRIPLRE